MVGSLSVSCVAGISSVLMTIIFAGPVEIKADD
jgi:hypothetical protein